MLTSNATAIEQGFEVSFDPDNELMLVEYTGSMGLKDLIDSFSAVIRHPKFKTNMPACYDFTNAVIDIDISAAEVVFYFVIGLKEKRGKDYQLAFVYQDEMSKTLFDYYRLQFSRTAVDVEIFNNRQAAIQWINDSQEPSTISYL